MLIEDALPFGEPSREFVELVKVYSEEIVPPDLRPASDDPEIREHYRSVFVEPTRNGRKSRLLWLPWLAGADSEILRECPRRERLFYSSLGSTMALSAILMAIGLFLFIENLGARSLVALVLALLVALTVLGMYRLEGASSWRPRYNVGEVFGIFIRVAFGLAMAALLAVPMGLFAFRYEVNSELAVQAAQSTANYQRSILNSPQLDNATEQLKAIQVEIRTTQNEIDKERDGSGGTGKAGLGPQYARLSDQYFDLQEQLKELTSIRNALLSEATRQVAEFSRLAGEPGFLVRVEALEKVTSRDPLISGLFGVFLLFLVLIIELPSVMIVMLRIGKPSSYQLIARFEERTAVQRYMLHRIRSDYAESNFFGRGGSSQLSVQVEDVAEMYEQSLIAEQNETAAQIFSLSAARAVRNAGRDPLGGSTDEGPGTFGTGGPA